MKKISFALGAIACSFFIVLGCNNNQGTTSEGSKDTAAVAPVAGTQAETPAAPMDSAAMMKAWEAYMTPGDMHKMLASFDGKWKEDLTMWMGPDAPPQKSTSEAENKMIMGGRYQQSIHKGSFDGMPFEGVSTVGYDNASKKLVSTWYDNMGTGIMYMTGTWDEGTKTMTFTGKQTDPMTGKDIDVRETMKIIDDKTHLMEMYQTQNGKEFKCMEIKFTRM